MPKHLSGIVQIGMVGQHDDRYRRTLRQKLHKRILLGLGWNVTITENHMNGGLSFGWTHPLNAFFSVVCLNNVIPLLRQRLADEQPDIFLTFDH